MQNHTQVVRLILGVSPSGKAAAEKALIAIMRTEQPGHTIAGTIHAIWNEITWNTDNGVDAALLTQAMLIGFPDHHSTVYGNALDSTAWVYSSNQQSSVEGFILGIMEASIWLKEHIKSRHEPIDDLVDHGQNAIVKILILSASVNSGIKSLDQHIAGRMTTAIIEFVKSFDLGKLLRVFKEEGEGSWLMAMKKPAESGEAQIVSELLRRIFWNRSPKDQLLALCGMSQSKPKISLLKAGLQ